ncbi:hypothetical protein [Bariatricus sp. HCP28S3_C2]|uniref:hypothetical protein n=1 Tax=unclassified Bariatricus TaxID=2677046 RepID=UPI003F8A45AA
MIKLKKIVAIERLLIVVLVVLYLYFIVLSSFTRFKEGEIPLTIILVVILFVGQQVYEGIAIRDNISQLTHVIGGAIGAFVGYRFNKSK